MSHDASKVVLGSTRSSFKEGSETFLSDPATFLAGLAVRRNSSNLLSLTKGDGNWVGVSLGKDLTDSKRTTVLKKGDEVPIRVSRQPARGTVTISSYANLLSGGADTITVGATVFTAQAGAATPGAGTFQAATSNDATATSLAAQINAHATAGGLVKASVVGAVVTLTAKSNAAGADTIALAYTEGGTGTGAAVSGATLEDSDDSADFVAIGQPVYISDDSGMADDPNSASTISNAVYISSLMTGISEDGTEVAAAMIAMVGGL